MESGIVQSGGDVPALRLCCNEGGNRATKKGPIRTVFETLVRLESFESAGFAKVEPMSGIEPPTYGLRNRCSTTELHWRPLRWPD
jgi:hypothetical protein